MLETILLDSQSKKKLALLNYLTKKPAGIYSLNTLKNEHGISYSQIGNLAFDIHLDFQRLGLPDFLTNSRKISWHPESFYFNRYKSYLLKKSVAYNYLAAVFFETNKTLEAFCEQQFISRATLNRRLKPIMVYIHSLHLELIVRKMTISGDEAVLRMLYICIFWTVEPGIVDARFGNYEQESFLLDTLPSCYSTFIHRQGILLILLVNRYRYEHKHEIRLSYFEGLATHTHNQEFIEYLKSYLKDPTELTHQLNFLSYLIYYAFHFVSEDDFRVNYVQQYLVDLRSQKKSIAIELDRLMTVIKEKFLPPLMSTSAYALVESNVFVTLLNYAIQQGPMPLLIDSTYSSLGTDNTLQTFLQRELKQELQKVCRRKNMCWITACINELSHTLSLTLLPFYSQELEPVKVVVGLTPLPNYTLLHEVKDFLQSLDFVTLKFTSVEHPDVDCYVSSFVKLIPNPDKPHFIISQKDTLDYQVLLFAKLRHLYVQKKEYNLKTGLFSAQCASDTRISSLT